MKEEPNKLTTEIIKTEKDVPVLKFIGDIEVVVFFEGRPVIASLEARYEKYNLKYVPTPGDSCYYDYIHHINAPNGTKATVKKLEYHYKVNCDQSQSRVKLESPTLEGVSLRYFASEITFM